MTSLLREARDAHGWTLDQAAARLIRLAANRKVQVAASQASLRQMISDMERGRRKPGHYAPLICELYARTKEELGFGSPGSESPSLELPIDLIGRIDRSDAVDSDTVERLQGQVDGIRLLDRQLGSPAVIESARSLVDLIKNLMSYSFQPSSRSLLAKVLADAATLNAWLALNNGDIAEAWPLYETAKLAAYESGSPSLLAHAMGEQAYALLDLDKASHAVGLLESAQSVATSKVPPLLRSWLYAAHAEVYAVLQNAPACRDALRQAIVVLPDDTDNSDVPYISLNDWHLTRWRGNVLAQLGDAHAVSELAQALDATDPSFVRATASLECDMAGALVAQGKFQEARTHASRAHSLATSTGSVRQLRRVRLVQRRLT